MAEAAEKKMYEAWLRHAADTPNSMHVVYINTSLVTKAMSQVGHGSIVVFQPLSPSR